MFLNILEDRFDEIKINRVGMKKSLWIYHCTAHHSLRGYFSSFKIPFFLSSGHMFFQMLLIEGFACFPLLFLLKVMRNKTTINSKTSVALAI